MLFGFILLQCIFTAGQGLAPYFLLFLVARFLAALFMTGAWMTPFSYRSASPLLPWLPVDLVSLGVGEMTTGVARTAVTGLFFVPYAFGYALLSPLAYFTMDWRIM